MATAEMSVRRERPDESEHAPYYGKYIAQVPDGDIVETLRSQRPEVLARWSAFAEAQGAHRYAPEKWSVRQVMEIGRAHV